MNDFDTIHHDAAAVASSWHDGMADPLYALGSSGGMVVWWPGAHDVTVALRQSAEEAQADGHLEDAAVMVALADVLQPLCDRLGDLADLTDGMDDTTTDTVIVDAATRWVGEADWYDRVKSVVVEHGLSRGRRITLVMS